MKYIEMNVPQGSTKRELSYFDRGGLWIFNNLDGLMYSNGGVDATPLPDVLNGKTWYVHNITY